jgi:hypothetical protein
VSVVEKPLYWGAEILLHYYSTGEECNTVIDFHDPSLVFWRSESKSESPFRKQIF